MSTQTAVAEKSADVVEQRLKQIILSVLRLEMPEDNITDETNLYELGLESLNVVELLTEAEMQFDIVVDVEDLSEELFARFGHLKAFVQQKIDES